MSDVVSPEKRSMMMAGIRGKNTKPEFLIRKSLHARGFRYKLHDQTLPGRPDMTFPKYHAVLFVHGCFWHRHTCKLFRWPQSNKDFWRKKLTDNSKRDKEQIQKLTESGWRVITIWECAIKGKKEQEIRKLTDDITLWLLSDKTNREIP